MTWLVLATVAALALALLFGSAFLQKLRHRHTFFQSLADYELLPQVLIPWAGGLMLVLELVICLGLVLPLTRGFAAMLGAGLLLLYGIAMAINLLRGRDDLDCGCGSNARNAISWWLVARNGALATLAWIVVTTPAAVLSIGAWLLVIVLIGISALLYETLERLHANHAAYRAWLNGHAE